MSWKQRIISDEKVLVGKPIIKGTRISVALLLDCLAAGWTEEMIFKSYPRVTREDMIAMYGYLRDGHEFERYFSFPPERS